MAHLSRERRRLASGRCQSVVTRRRSHKYGRTARSQIADGSESRASWPRKSRGTRHSDAGRKIRVEQKPSKTGLPTSLPAGPALRQGPTHARIQRAVHSTAGDRARHELRARAATGLQLREIFISTSRSTPGNQGPSERRRRCACNPIWPKATLPSANALMEGRDSKARLASSRLRSSGPNNGTRLLVAAIHRRAGPGGMSGAFEKIQRAAGEHDSSAHRFHDHRVRRCRSCARGAAPQRYGARPSCKNPSGIGRLMEGHTTACARNWRRSPTGKIRWHGTATIGDMDERRDSSGPSKSSQHRL